MLNQDRPVPWLQGSRESLGLSCTRSVPTWPRRCFPAWPLPGSEHWREAEGAPRDRRRLRPCPAGGCVGQREWEWARLLPGSLKSDGFSINYCLVIISAKASSSGQSSWPCHRCCSLQPSRLPAAECCPLTAGWWTQPARGALLLGSPRGRATAHVHKTPAESPCVTLGEPQPVQPPERRTALL